MTLQANPIKTIALVGNPNSGKTTLFNAFTKLRQKVGNYPGVTVEKKTGSLVLASDRIVNVIDLPGTYSLAVRSPDEAVARDVLLGKTLDTQQPDLVVCVVDAGNLERNLYLVSQVQDLGIPMIVALNMMDELALKGKKINIAHLSEDLGVPVYPIVANQNQGLEELKEAIAKGGIKPNLRRWQMPQALENDIKVVEQMLIEAHAMTTNEAFLQTLIILSAWPKVRGDWPSLAPVIDKIIESHKANGINAKTAPIEARYTWIKKIVSRSLITVASINVDLTEQIDKWLTHRIFGWIIFLGMMSFMFFMIFTIASYPMDFISSLIANLGNWVSGFMSDGLLKDLIINGVLAGVGGVLVFLPQILILYFFIGLLQDTGYMARAAFIMDRVMSKFGLHGKSFIPLLSSFACAIPGIMASRTIETPKDRLVTILVAPLMSCSARLPVYTILIALLIPQASGFQKALVMLSMYVLGIVAACCMALIFKKTLLRSQRPVFVMELPPYRLPSIKTIMMQMLERASMFIKRAGTIILAISIVLWALMSFPRIEGAKASEQLSHSYAGQMGKFIEPVIKPLGYDWRIGVGLIGSFAAREVFVSTMSIVFNIEDNIDEKTLSDSFSHAKHDDGRLLFTPAVTLSLLVFYVFALQCLSTVVTVYRETNSWKWCLFQLTYLTVLAYLSAFIAYQVLTQILHLT